MSFRFLLIFIIFLSAVFGIPRLMEKNLLEDAILNAKDQKVLYLEPKIPSKSLAEGAELIYLSAYGANEKEDGVGVVHVEIDRPQSKILLMLYNQNQIRWRISVKPKTIITGIVASGYETPEVFTNIETRGYDAELPISFEVENVAFKVVEARLNQLFGVTQLDVYRGSYGMPGLISISSLKPVRFGPIDKSLFFELGRTRVRNNLSHSASAIAPKVHPVDSH